jgi:putative peptide zinc metalloprotease protein
MNASDAKNFFGFEDQFVLDTLEKKQSYLIIGKNGSRIKLSSSAYQLLRAGAAGVSFEELAQIANSNHPKAKVSKEQLEEAYAGLLQQLNAIEAQAAGSRLPFGFWFRFRLLPEKMARRIGAFVSFFYNPHIALIVLTFTAATFYLSFRHGFMLSANDAHVFPAYLLFLFSLMIHEFGHAAACVRYGGSPSDIGFTVYLISPAFYSDVSSAWQLKRWQRVIVDLGGNYFQFIIGCCFLWADNLTHWPPLQLAAVLICYSAIFSLNPIFKFDGYWVLADVLGVTNLAKQTSNIAKYCYSRLLRKPAAPLPWSMSITGVLFAYSISSIFIWSIFVWKTLPMLWHRVGMFGDYFIFIISELRSRQLPQWAELRALAVSLFFLVISAMMIWRMMRQMLWPVFRRAVSFLIKSPQPS